MSNQPIYPQPDFRFYITNCKEPNLLGHAFLTKPAWTDVTQIKSRKKFLNALKITEEQFKLYKELFFLNGWSLSNGKRFNYDKNNWSIKVKQLTDYDILRHLGGMYYYARRASKYTSIIAIDIDNYTNPLSHFDSFTYTFEKVINSFDATPLIFRSSMNNGLHIYYLLDRSYPAYEVKQIIEEYFKLFLYVEYWPYGRNLEVFPSESHVLRYPLGRHSFLLDKELNIFRRNLSATLDCIKRMIESPRFRKLDFIKIKRAVKNTKIEDQYLNPIIIPKQNTTNPKVQKVKQQYEKFKISGITKPGERRELTFASAWYLVKYRGMSADDVFKQLKTNLISKHNGKSKDYNKNPKAVLKELKKICEKYESERRHNTYSQDKKSARYALSEGDIDKALKLGKKTGSYKLLRFTLELANFIFKNSHKKDGNIYYCYISSSCMQNFPAFSRNAYMKFKDMLIAEGILSVWEKPYFVEGDAGSGQCTCYKLKWNVKDEGKRYEGNSIDDIFVQYLERYTNRIRKTRGAGKKLSKYLKLSTGNLSNMLNGRRAINPKYISKIIRWVKRNIPVINIHLNGQTDCRSSLDGNISVQRKAA